MTVTYGKPHTIRAAVGLRKAGPRSPIRAEVRHVDPG